MQSCEQDATGTEQRQPNLAHLHQQIISAVTGAVVSPHVSVALTSNIALSHPQQQQVDRPASSLQLSLEQPPEHTTGPASGQLPTPLLSPSLGRLGSIHPPSQPSPLLSPASQARRSPVKHVFAPTATTTPLGCRNPASGEATGNVFFPQEESLPAPQVVNISTAMLEADTEPLSEPSQSDVVTVQEADSILVIVFV